MIRAAMLGMVLVAALSMAACGGGTSASAPEPASTAQKEDSVVGETAAATGAAPEQATVIYTVPTITCPSCPARVKANAEKDRGVLDVRVEAQRVTVGYDPAKTDPAKIAEAIGSGGDTVLPDG